MNSSIAAYYILRLISVVFIILGIALTHAYFFPENSIVDGVNEKTPISLPELLYVITIIGFFAWGAFTRLARIICDEGGVTLIRNGKLNFFEWGEIKSVKMIPFTAPPLYRMTFKDTTTPAYFMMALHSHFYIETPIFTQGLDSSGFKKYAQDNIDKSKSAD